MKDALVLSIPVMTDEQIDSMDAGPEMDRAVANVVGLDRGDRFWFWTDTGLHWESEVCPGAFITEFHPSTEWDAAMFAAEKFGLFYNAWIEQCSAGWRVRKNHDDEWTEYSESSSGPLAICRAILKLARDK